MIDSPWAAADRSASTEKVTVARVYANAVLCGGGHVPKRGEAGGGGQEGPTAISPSLSHLWLGFLHPGVGTLLVE